MFIIGLHLYYFCLTLFTVQLQDIILNRYWYGTQN